MTHERQAKYTASQKARGLVKVCLWVPVSKRDELRRLASMMCDDKKEDQERFVTAAVEHVHRGATE